MRTNTQLLVTFLVGLVFVAASLSIITKIIVWACQAPRRRDEAELRGRQLAELRAKQGA